MRRSVLTFLLIILCFASFAQPKGYSAAKNVESFKTALAQSNASVQTISSDFLQTKNLSLLAEKIKSKGKFYFKKDNKVRIEYTTPFSYLLVMNNGQMMVKDEQKSSKINTRNSKMMQSVNRVIIDCMRGSVFQNPDFRVTVYENAQHYLLSLVPVAAAMKKMFSQIDVYMNRKGLDVDRLIMTEQGGDFTNMEFTNTHHNTPLDEALFKIK